MGSTPVLLPAATVAVVLGGIQLLYATGRLPMFLPAPSALWNGLIGNPGLLLANMAPTAVKAAIGFAIAAAIALFGAAVCSHVRGELLTDLQSWRHAAEHPRHRSHAAARAVAGHRATDADRDRRAGGAVPMLAGAMQGFRSVDTRQRELFHTLSASPLQRLRLLVLPPPLPTCSPGSRSRRLRRARHHHRGVGGGRARVGALMLSALFAYDPGDGMAVGGGCLRVGRRWLWHLRLDRTARRVLGPAGGPRAVRVWVVRLAVVAVLVLLWQGAIAYWALPAISCRHRDVSRRRLRRTGACWWHGRVSPSFRVPLALPVSFVFAAAIALAFTASTRLARASMPLVIVFRSAPVPAVAPLIMLATGRGIGTSVLVVTIVAFFPLYVNLLRGLSVRIAARWS